MNHRAKHKNKQSDVIVLFFAARTDWCLDWQVRDVLLQNKCIYNSLLIIDNFKIETVK